MMNTIRYVEGLTKQTIQAIATCEAAKLDASLPPLILQYLEHKYIFLKFELDWLEHAFLFLEAVKSGDMPDLSMWPFDIETLAEQLKDTPPEYIGYQTAKRLGLNHGR